MDKLEYFIYSAMKRITADAYANMGECQKHVAEQKNPNKNRVLTE